MATVQSEYQKFMSRNAMKLFDFDPDVATVVNVPTDAQGWLDMQDYEGAICTFFRTVGASALDTFDIIANSESDGSGTDATIVVGMPVGASEPNAVGDQIHLEISAEMLASLSTSTTGSLRYVTSAVEVATGTDEAVIAWTRYGTRNAKDGLTADIIA